MSRRWPNTPIWQFVEKNLQILHGKSWRRQGEFMFGFERGTLRVRVDREMTAKEEIAIERTLTSEMRLAVAKCREFARRADEAAAMLADDCARRRYARWCAERNETYDLLDEVCTVQMARLGLTLDGKPLNMDDA